ncbi:MAG: hypothetical protein QOH69_624 [Actinomycetota bacterium]|nr:hypothetical protein [Actinomycetota bacterium]
MLILLVIGLLALGVMIGGIAGGIITGDWWYTLVWTVAMGVLVLYLVFAGTTYFRRAAKGTDRPVSKLPRPAQLAIAVMLVVAAAGTTLIPSAAAVGRIGTNQNMLTGAYQQEAVDAIAKVVGTHELVDIDFYDSYVIAQAPTKPGADTSDDYQYRYGRAERLGPEQGAADTKTAEYDGRKVDFALIPKLIKDAERRTKTSTPTSLHVFVMQQLDRKAGQAPTINIQVDDAYHSNQVDYTAQGKFLNGVGDAFADN